MLSIAFKCNEDSNVYKYAKYFRLCSFSIEKGTWKQPFVMMGSGASTSEEVVAVKELKDPIHASNLLLQISVFILGTRQNLRRHLCFFLQVRLRKILGFAVFIYFFV